MEDIDLNLENKNESPVWLKVVDFQTNEIYYENRLTEKKYKEVPFGVDENEIPIIGRNELNY